MLSTVTKQAFLAKEAALQVEQAQEYAKAAHVRSNKLNVMVLCVSSEQTMI